MASQTAHLPILPTCTFHCNHALSCCGIINVLTYMFTLPRKPCLPYLTTLDLLLELISTHQNKTKNLNLNIISSENMFCPNPKVLSHSCQTSFLAHLFHEPLGFFGLGTMSNLGFLLLISCNNAGITQGLKRYFSEMKNRLTNQFSLHGDMLVFSIGNLPYQFLQYH